MSETSLSYREFVAMIAATMALMPSAIDSMLPALPAIGRDFNVSDPSRLQWIITVFVMGAGAGQLVYGPLADRFGRRPVLLAALTLFMVLSLVASAALQLHWLVLARA